jgi:hypothetical protein
VSPSEIPTQGAIYLYQTSQAMHIYVVRHDAAVQLLPDMLLLAVLWSDSEDPLCLKDAKGGPKGINLTALQFAANESVVQKYAP